MISEIPGFTVSRVIPRDCLLGVITGAYNLCGGVIRKPSGQIVAHLIDGSNPLDLLNPLNTTFAAVNTFQLHKIGRGLAEVQDTTAALEKVTSDILGLAKGTMVLSGLTLAVSAATFLFLNNKLRKIDEKLKQLAKNVKAIEIFLQSKEKAALTAALKTLSGVDTDLADKIRIPLLTNARQTLGEIHERYKDQMYTVTRIVEVIPVEEYYSVTALGHAMCSAELDMLNNAVSDLEDAYQTWLDVIRGFSNNVILREDPERFLFAVYAKNARTDEVIDWLDFARGEDRGIEWVDELRGQTTPVRLPQRKLNNRDLLELEAMRKFTARNRVYSGYTAQYGLLKGFSLRPSVLQQYCKSLDDMGQVNDCFLFVANQQKKTTS